MADLSDVETAIVTQVIAALYPNGVSQPSAVVATCRIYRGWPTPAGLNADLAAGTVNITVFPSSEPDEVPDSYFDRVYAITPPSELLATVAGQSVTLSGMISANQTIGLLVDGVPFYHGVEPADTLNSIAGNLASQISETRLAILNGQMITVPDAMSLIGPVVTAATVSSALRRQRREIHIICWCPSPALRDLVTSTVDMGQRTVPFLTLPDGTKAHARYVSTQVYDQSQNALLYRRDLRYRYEYTMLQSSLAPVMLFGDLWTNQDKSVI